MVPMLGAIIRSLADARHREGPLPDSACFSTRSVVMMASRRRFRLPRSWPGGVRSSRTGAGSGKGPGTGR